jgi:hypothetical protein
MAAATSTWGARDAITLDVVDYMWEENHEMVRTSQ